MKRVLYLFVILCVFVISIYFLFPHPAAAIGDTTVVQIVGPAQAPGFSPALLTIHQYDTVIFVNKTTTPYALSTSDNSFSSPAIPAGQRWRTTFSGLGAHEYHTTQSSQHMAGEILVVANSISLLPTPVPQIEATVLAIIKAGKHPPDTIVLPASPQESPFQHSAKGKQTNMLLSPLVLGIAGGVLLLLILLFIILLLLRRHRRRVREEEEMDTLIEEIVPKTIAHKSLPAPTSQKKRRPLLAGLRRRRTDDDEDMDNEDE